MRTLILFTLVQLSVAILPLFGTGASHAKGGSRFPGWPKTFQGAAIIEVGLRPEERRWAESFPGKIGRFTDGRREILIRYVSTPTRSLHPASDCFAAQGFHVMPKRVRVDQLGTLWGCFEAAKGSSPGMTVCEQISDETSRHWSDASSWYWEASFDNAPHDYWAVTIADSLGTF